MPDDEKNWLAEARSHAAAGDHLQAYDVAMRGLERRPQDPAAVLALARSGATAKARERYIALGLDEVSFAEVAPPLYIDIAALDARIAKDLALAASAEYRKEHLTEAAIRYRVVFDETGHYYPGVNAATLLRLAGYAEEANALAASVRAICERRIGDGVECGYYVWATLAEAHLIASNEAGAAAALKQARRATDASPDALAATRRQFRLLFAATGLPESLLEVLHPDTVVHYAGHMIGPRLSEA
jgi:hypothetical protein